MSLISLKAQLASSLLAQNFNIGHEDDSLLASFKNLVQGYVDIENGVGVLSDFQADKSYIYIGSFGKQFGLPYGNLMIDSAFEECIFDKVDPDDLRKRHQLEISYLAFQKNLTIEERLKYSTFSRIRIYNTQGTCIFVNHRTIYLKYDDNSNVHLALCTYVPSPDQHSSHQVDGQIINNESGETVKVTLYGSQEKKLLGAREVEVLSLIAKGMGSKEIAEKLSIAAFTVARHRQNIIRKMKVSNSIEAVKAALDMRILNH